MSDDDLKTDLTPGNVDQEPVKEKTWEEELEAAKTNYFIVKSTIDHREEPIETMKDLSDFIEKVIEDPSRIEEPAEVKEFFYKECANNILKRLNKERSADPKVSFLQINIQITFLNSILK
jgi:hypothetical protein